MGVNLASWFMCAWSLVTMYLLSEGKYKLGWTSSLLSQAGWIWVAGAAGIWGSAFYSTVMIFICIKALRKLRVGGTE